MKKLFLALGVIAVVGLASCSKEKTCKCTTKAPLLDDVVTTEKIEDGKCSDLNTTAGVGEAKVEKTCVRD